MVMAHLLTVDNKADFARQGSPIERKGPPHLQGRSPRTGNADVSSKDVVDGLRRAMRDKCEGI